MQPSFFLVETIVPARHNIPVSCLLIRPSANRRVLLKDVCRVTLCCFWGKRLGARDWQQHQDGAAMMCLLRVPLERQPILPR